MSGYVQVITTISDKRSGEKIANTIIGKRLAACVQIAGPVKSIYRWKGRIETAREWVCAIKTEDRLRARVEKEIKTLHPYEVPEIIVVSMEGSSDYLKWISGEVLKKKEA